MNRFLFTQIKFLFGFFVLWHINLCRLFNAKAVLLVEQLWYYLTYSWDDRGVHTFPKGICLKVNVLARLEYELAYYDSAVHRFNHYTTRTPRQIKFSHQQQLIPSNWWPPGKISVTLTEKFLSMIPSEAPSNPPQNSPSKLLRSCLSYKAIENKINSVWIMKVKIKLVVIEAQERLHNVYCIPRSINYNDIQKIANHGKCRQRDIFHDTLARWFSRATMSSRYVRIIKMIAGSWVFSQVIPAWCSQIGNADGTKYFLWQSQFVSAPLSTKWLHIKSESDESRIKNLTWSREEIK